LPTPPTQRRGNDPFRVPHFVYRLAAIFRRQKVRSPVQHGPETEHGACNASIERE